MVLVLATGAAGLALAAERSVALQSALLVFAASPGLGAVLRAVLPARLAGLLCVRTRLFDTLVLAALAAGIAVLAVATPTGAR
jgi:O-methyltransferase involved in polyketide biosynthesis